MRSRMRGLMSAPSPECGSQRVAGEVRKVAEARLEAADAQARYRAAVGEPDTMVHWRERMEALVGVLECYAREIPEAHRAQS